MITVIITFSWKAVRLTFIEKNKECGQEVIVNIHRLLAPISRRVVVFFLIWFCPKSKIPVHVEPDLTREQEFRSLLQSLVEIPVPTVSISPCFWGRPAHSPFRTFLRTLGLKKRSNETHLGVGFLFICRKEANWVGGEQRAAKLFTHDHSLRPCPISTPSVNELQPAPTLETFSCTLYAICWWM